jgi:hypothetical protein
MQVLRGQETSEVDEYGFSSFVYRARRPFHPERFWALVQNEWPGVVRSKGFFWLATRPEFVGGWSQAGGSCQVEGSGLWWAAVPSEEWQTEEEETVAEIRSNWGEPYGDRRQELVLIGQDMDQQRLIAMLDEALLTEDEMAQGQSVWNTFFDPFDAWPVANSEPAELVRQRFGFVKLMRASLQTQCESECVACGLSESFRFWLPLSVAQTSCICGEALFFRWRFLCISRLFSQAMGVRFGCGILEHAPPFPAFSS